MELLWNTRLGGEDWPPANPSPASACRWSFRWC